MRRLKLTTLGFVVLLLAGNQSDPEDDPAALQGEWEIISVERSGSPDTAPLGHTVRFSGDQVHFEAADGRMIIPKATFHEQNLRIPS